MGRPKVKESKAQSFRLRADIGERLGGYPETNHIPKLVRFPTHGFLQTK